MGQPITGRAGSFAGVTFLLLVGFSLCSCTGTVADVAAARKAVVHFHQQLDQEKYADMYAEAAPELREATKQQDFLALMSAVHRKLGVVQDATQSQFNVNWTTSGTRVHLNYQTKFAGGSATETFTWKTGGDRPSLVGYNINSNALILK
jgi:hypothetical protein